MTEREAIERHIKKKGITRLPPVTEENFWELHLKRDERTGYDPLTGAPLPRKPGKKKRGK